MAADRDRNATDAEPVDVDEDGNPIPPRDRRAAPADESPREEEAAGPAGAGLAVPPGKTGLPTLLRPQPTQGGSTLAILAQHFDMPQEFATFLRQLDNSFLTADYLYAVDVNAYWKVRESLDFIVSLIAGQVDKDSRLGSQVPAFLSEYWSVEDYAEDWNEEIRRKVFLFSKLVKVAGLGTKDRAEPMKSVPAEAMSLQIRADLEPWQVRPDEAGVVQVAELLVEAIRKKRLMVLLVDVDPFSGLAYGGGKSQLLWQVLYWAHRELAHVFDPRKDIVYRRDHARLKRMFKESEPVPWGIDEFNQFFDKWEWQNKENKPYTYELQMYRKVGRPIVGACGSLWETNERVRMQILTNRLSITKWDEDRYVGEAVLYRKYGPPAAQDEEENKWGLQQFPISFNGLNAQQFAFYNTIADTARDQGDGGLDKLLVKDPAWLEDLLPKTSPAIADPDKDSAESSEI